MAGHVGKLAYHPLMRAVARGLRHRCGVCEGDRLLVAVSGGADSVALLRGLAILAPRNRWRLHLAVAHIQHHQRGDEAEQDARFVERLAHDLNLQFMRQDVNTEIAIPRDGAKSSLPGNLEARMRVLRYAALHDIARKASCDAVVTGHHADDQLETMLMRLLRGSSVRGLTGMAWRRTLQHETECANDPAPTPTGGCIMLLRPMLATTHEQAIDFLRQLDQPWREDHTNADPQRTRARLRRDVLPVLREMRGDVAEKATQMADRLRELLGQAEE